MQKGETTLHAKERREREREREAYLWVLSHWWYLRIRHFLKLCSFIEMCNETNKSSNVGIIHSEAHNVRPRTHSMATSYQFPSFIIPVLYMVHSVQLRCN
jgi:hypothetical protein